MPPIGWPRHGFKANAPAKAARQIEPLCLDADLRQTDIVVSCLGEVDGQEAVPKKACGKRRIGSALREKNNGGSISVLVIDALPCDPDANDCRTLDPLSD